MEPAPPSRTPQKDQVAPAPKRKQSSGVNEKEVEDKAAVHGLEHGGIWISYKDVDEETIRILGEIGKENSGSVERIRCL